MANISVHRSGRIISQDDALLLRENMRLSRTRSPAPPPILQLSSTMLRFTKLFYRPYASCTPIFSYISSSWRLRGIGTGICAVLSSTRVLKSAMSSVPLQWDLPRCGTRFTFALQSRYQKSTMQMTCHPRPPIAAAKASPAGMRRARKAVSYRQYLIVHKQGRSVWYCGRLHSLRKNRMKMHERRLQGRTWSGPVSCP